MSIIQENESYSDNKKDPVWRLKLHVRNLKVHILTIKIRIFRLEDY